MTPHPYLYFQVIISRTRLAHRIDFYNALHNSLARESVVFSRPPSLSLLHFKLVQREKQQNSLWLLPSSLGNKRGIKRKPFISQSKRLEKRRSFVCGSILKPRERELNMLRNVRASMEDSETTKTNSLSERIRCLKWRREKKRRGTQSFASCWSKTPTYE